MIRTLILLAAVALLALAWRWFRRTHRQQGKPFLLRTLALLGLVLLLGLALTGKLNWLLALLAGLLTGLARYAPLLVKLGPLLHDWWRRQQGQQPGARDQTSQLRTATLNVTLHHESGEIQGEVLGGPLAGRRVESLTAQEMASLLHYCQQQDTESVAVVNTLAERRFGPGWQQNGEAAPPPPTSGPMTRQEALAVLGLGERATRDEIVKAHRRLMQKMHPDRGGSEYLAARLNEARDVLLG